MLLKIIYNVTLTQLSVQLVQEMKIPLNRISFLKHLPTGSFSTIARLAPSITFGILFFQLHIFYSTIMKLR